MMNIQSFIGKLNSEQTEKDFIGRKLKSKKASGKIKVEDFGQTSTRDTDRDRGR